MTGKIITISRQYGSGGRSVGKLVAEKLGIHCFDSAIIDRIAKESGFSEEYIKNQSEDAVDAGWFAALAGSNFYGQSNQDLIWITQCKVIEDLAKAGDCVIVGRCADYILKGKFDLLKVFIYADNDSRVKRMIEEYGEKDDNPYKRLKEKDRKRGAYYEIYTDQQFGDFSNYDVCLNSGSLGVDLCADFIADIYRLQSHE